jgi:hypothetical protein
MRCASAERGALALLCAALGACANPGTGLSTSDSDASFTGLRASWEVPRPRFSQGRPPPRQVLAQAELSDTDADFLDDLHQASVDARLRLRGEHLFGLDLTGGLGFARLDLDGNQGVPTGDSQEQGLGPRLGLGLFCELPPRLRLFLDGVWQPTFVGAGDVADLQAFDLGVDVRLTSSIELVLGWRWLAYEQERSGADPDLDLEAAGPRLSLALRF